jgi:hypothetical protein
MKLYAWQPNGHGQLSFFVCAESEEAARAAVESQIAKLEFGDYAVRGWGTDYYELTAAEPGEVIEHAND